MLAHIIAEQGWRAPITVSRRSGYIVRGHARRLASYEAGSRYDNTALLKEILGEDTGDE